MVRRARRLLVLFLVVLPTSCVGDDGVPNGGRATASDPRLRGSLLVFTSFRGGLSTIELPDGDARPLDMPAGPSYLLAGYFADDGSVVAVVERGIERARAYRLGHDERPVALGPMLRGVFTFSLAGDALVAAECGARPAAFLLNVASQAEWERIDGACGATLSPDGSSLAWSPDGHTLMEASADGTGSARAILDIREISGLPPGMQEDVEIIGELRWGPNGLAIPLGTSERQAVAVLSAGGNVDVTPLGNHGAGVDSLLAWEPEGGDMLAAATWSNLEAVLRVFQVGQGESRVVAMHPDPIAGLVWSPDGKVLLAASQAQWTFVTPGGDWLRSTPITRRDSLPLAWRSG
jgi:WD40-like Beta Propeller Repeat